MTLLDTSAVLTFLRGEPGDDEVSELLRGRDCAIPAPCLSEVVDRLIRRDGYGAEDVTGKLASLLGEIAAVPSVDMTAGLRAGVLRSEHYHREKAPLSQVDCFVLAMARGGDAIATSDGSLIDVAIRLEIPVIPLPDSQGRRQKLD